MYVNTESDRTAGATAGQKVMPFYLLLDVSGSMQDVVGEIADMVDDLISEITDSPVVDDAVMIGIITFNHEATTCAPLAHPRAFTAPRITATGGTNYGAAFREFARVFEEDRRRLKQQGMQVYRPCVFFLSDGVPQDADHLETFKSLFAYDPTTKQGNAQYPYFVPFGCRDASERVIRSLAYPNFGDSGKKGKWFMSRSTDPRDALRELTKMIAVTVVTSGMTVVTGQTQRVQPKTPEYDAGAGATASGEAGEWM